MRTPSSTRTPLRLVVATLALSATGLWAGSAASAATPLGTSPEGSANPSVSNGPTNPTVPQPPTSPTAPSPTAPTVPDMQAPSDGHPKTVIPPPPTGDSNVLPPPDQGAGTMPVVPAPGTPGGNPNVQPK